MPTWKKVVISGSGVAQLSNDANYLAQSGTDAILTGSFTGSFTGDGSGLTNIVAPGTISSSAQIASDISGAFGADSGSFSTRITDLETFSSSLDNTFASEAELNASSSTLQTNIDTVDTDLTTASSSLATRLTTIEDDNATQTELDSVSSSLASDVSTNATNITNNSASLAASITTNATNHTTVSSSLASRVTAQEDFSASLGTTFTTDAELNASSSTLQSNIDTVSSSLASRVTSNDTDISTLQSFSSSVDTAFNFDGANVTVAGNLTVSGTQTIVDSTTLDIGDNIISLNGTAATLGGLHVNDGPVSGSILWDGTNDRWIAGGSGSEVPVALREGQGLLSSSAQIASDISGSFTSTSASLAASITTVDTDLTTASSSLASRVSTIEDDNATQTELDAVSASLATSITTVDTDLTTASSSLASRVSTIEDDNATQTELDAVSASLATDVTTNATDITNNSASLAASITTNATNHTTVSSSLASRVAAQEEFSSSLGADFSTDAELNASSSTLQTNIDNASSSLAANIASNDTDISALQTFSSSVDTAMNFDGSNVTVVGNLTVSGTTTTVDSTTVQFEDNIIALNGTAAALGGIHVNDSNGPASGSLLWDGTNNKWVAGASGSEVDLALLQGQGILSSSAQIASDISGSFTSTSASLATSITNNSASLAASITTNETNITNNSSSLAGRIAAQESFSSSLGTTFTTDAELNASSSALTTAYTSADTTLSASLAADIATNKSNLDNLEQSAITTGSNSFSVKIDSGSATLTSASSDILEIGDVYNQGDGSVDIRVPNGAGWLELNYADTDFIYLDGANAGINLDNNFEWTFYGASGLLATPGEVRVPAASVFSGSLSGPTVTADTVNGTAINGTINADNSVVSSSAQTVANLVNQDVNLGTGTLTGSSATFSSNVRIEGNLTTTGTVTNINATDLNVEDKFILLNSGSSAGNGGVIVQNSATVGQGTALFFDDTANRWGLDFAGADATGDTATADAYIAAVVTSDDANYQKNGNIRVNTSTGEAFIYVE